MDNTAANDPIRPLQIPAEHDRNAPFSERVIYALAYLGEGTAEEVYAKLGELGSDDATEHAVEEVLEGYYQRGLVNGTNGKPPRRYNLAKETTSHTGWVNPDAIV